MTAKMLRRHLNDYHHEAYLWARQCCDFDEELAKDVIQGVYLKILEGKAVWNQRSAFKTWIFSVIRFTAIDHKRDRRTHLPLSEFMEEPESRESQDGPDYRKVIGLLPKRQAEVLLLAFYHDMTLEQVATVTALGIGTVRTHYDRGKKALRKLLTEKPHDHATRP